MARFSKHIDSLKLVSIIIVLFTLCLALTCCLPRPSVQNLQTDVAADLDGVSAHEHSVLDGVVYGVMNQYDLETYGLSKETLCDTWLDGFTYRIGDAVSSGDWATVPVTLHLKPLYPVVSSWKEACEEYEKTPEYEQATAEERNEYESRLLKDFFSQAALVDIPIELQYYIESNSWQPSEGYEAVLASALVGLD